MSDKNFTSIPIVNVSRLYSNNLKDRLAVAKELGYAARHVGFVYITGHHINPDVFDRARSAAKDFFKLDMEVKMRYYIGNSSNHKGYVPEGEEVFQASKKRDHKESFDIGIEVPTDHPLVLAGVPLLGPNKWPTEIKDFRERAETFYYETLKLGSYLSRGFALGLGLDEYIFERMITTPPSNMRMIHYPADTNREDIQGIGAHTDFDLFTMLLAEESGLEVLNDSGQWIDAPPIENALIVNIGDMLEVMTAGEYVATTHRVRKVKEERLSFPVFYVLDNDAIVQPLPQFANKKAAADEKYRPFVSGDHAWNQTVQTYKYLMQKAKKGDISMKSDVKLLSTFGNFKTLDTDTISA